jgi:hypothetical protein
MNRRAFVQVAIAAVSTIASGAAIGLSLPRKATAEDALGVWLGYTVDGDLYRIELKAGGGGTFIVSNPEGKTWGYRLKSWSLSETWVVSIVAEGIDYPEETVFVDGHLMGTPSKLTIKNQSDWRRDLTLFREQTLNRQITATSKRANDGKAR